MTAPRTSHDIFINMGRTLAEPTRWTKGFAARDHHGNPCDPCSPKATCHCLYGARDVELFKITDEARRAELEEETDEILHSLVNSASPSAFNDDRMTTHADVVELISQAASKASASRNA